MNMIEPDQIWINGLIETLDAQNPFATAIAISQGRIIAVGNDQEVLNLKRSGTKIFMYISLRGVFAGSGEEIFL